MGQNPEQATAESPGERWRARRLASWLLRAAILLAPLVGAVLASLWLSTQLPTATTPMGVVAWWLTLIVASSAVAWAVDRIGRRLLPLTVMLRMTMLFPDRAPSRFRMSLRSSNVTELKRRVAAAETGASDLSNSAELILSLATALNNHDRRTRGHGERTRAYTDMLAEELRIPEEGRDKLRWAALLHDIGKLEVPSEILNKDGPLDDTEQAVIRRHPVMGMKVAAAIVPWLGQWAGAIEHHHEWWDGSGYPGGLHGGDIALAARIVSVADAYDVMTSGRSYQAAKRPDEARREVAAMAGTQFDPLVARALLNVSLGKLRWTVGPFAWLGSVPFMLDRIGRDIATLSTAATVTATAAFTGIVAAPALFPDQPPPITAQADGIVGGPREAGMGEDGGAAAGDSVDGGLETTDVTSQTTIPPTSTSSTTTTDPQPAGEGDPLLPGASSSTSTTSTTSSSSTTSTIAPTTTTTSTTLPAVTSTTIAAPPTTTPTSPPSTTATTTTTTTPPTTTTTRPPTTTTTTLPPPSTSTTTTTLPPTTTVPTTTTTTLPLPLPVDDPLESTDEDKAVTISVLNNDPGGFQVEEVVDAPDNGSAEVLSHGAIRYVPDSDWHGVDSFTYRACKDDTCGMATVTVTVHPVDDPPESSDDTADTYQDTPTTIDVLANDTDADGDTLTIDAVTAPGTGTASISNDAVEYTPAGGWTGTDTFGYRACDGSSCTEAIVTVTVHPNRPPVAADDATETGGLGNATIDVLSNDTDPDGNLDSATVEVTVEPENGSATENDDGSIHYQADLITWIFGQVVTFEYRVCDTAGLCDEATVSVSVPSIFDPD